MAICRRRKLESRKIIFRIPMQKIAVIIPKYGLTGGAEQFAAELTNRLAAQTPYAFHVVANRWGTSSSAQFHKAPIISFPKFLTTPSFAYFSKKRIERGQFALVHSHERIFAADLFTMHGIPHRYWVRNIRRKTMSLFDRATDWVERKMVYEGNCKRFIAVSTLARDIFLQEYPLDPARVLVIHPGIDPADYEQFDRRDVRHHIRGEFGINLSEPVIVFVSMNFEIKGLDEIMSALAKLKAKQKKFKLVVVGKGNIKKYQRLANENQCASDVLFTGPLSKEKLIQIYLAGDLFIMLSKFDTFGMVVLEAMAAGLPVIISSRVGAKDIVRENENGFIVRKTADADDIATKMAFLLDEKIREKFAASAQETAKQNSWTNVANKYAAIYEQILGKRSTMI
jgi:UDP-glucose:(heptosyl)LPS alpha-1,3-glucosyltransferase